MLFNELHDGRGVFQSVRVVANTGFGDEGDVTTEGFVAIGDQSSVLLPRDDIVGISVDMQQWDLGLGPESFCTGPSR